MKSTYVHEYIKLDVNKSNIANPYVLRKTITNRILNNLYFKEQNIVAMRKYFYFSNI